jgi:hypothetical protein
VIPDTIGAVFGVFLAVSPGLIFEFVRERRRPTAERSAFREAAWVAAASLAFSTAALILILLLEWALPDVFADPGSWLAGGTGYVKDHVPQVVVFVVSWTVLGCALAGLTAMAVIKETAEIDPNATAWYFVFRKRWPPGPERSVRVRLRDGDEYTGRVVYYDAHILHADRELVLGPPLTHKPPASGRFEPLPPVEGWQRIVIPASSIEAMWVRYPRKKA